MSKVEIVGPKSLVDDVLSLLRTLGILHPEPEPIGFIETPDEGYLRSYLLDDKALSEMLFLEDLLKKVDDLLFMLPLKPERKSYLEPANILDTIVRLLQEHCNYCEKTLTEIDKIEMELNKIKRYIIFMEALEKLSHGIELTSTLDITGFIIKDKERIEQIRSLIERFLSGRCIFLHTIAADGSIVALLATPRVETARVRELLVTEQIPEIDFPAIEGISMKEKITYLRNRLERLIEKKTQLLDSIKRFSLRWGPIYERVREWIQERLSILKAKGLVFETRMCFIVYGWMPSDEVSRVMKEFEKRFGGQIILNEREIRSEELDRVPVMLKNPPYFKPFEIFTRLLPLPSYTSYDPTVFIGLFFPIFFGMILGDAGYGILLIILSIYTNKRFKGRRYIEDGAKILLISSAYSVFFGILYGEFFGELGSTFGLKPLCVERRTAIIPMLYFALTVGIAHILFGMLLGIITALRRKSGKELLLRLINVLVLLSILILVGSISGILPELLTKPVIILILILTPLLFFSGGIIAPLEVLRSIGNIISYARIMAIGLTSVLLAFVANRLSGLTGNILMGIAVASLLHMLNIIIGIFSPTIHSLRLHYVEFLTKFIESGGRRYEPLSSKR